jgi:hypothetical protein
MPGNEYAEGMIEHDGDVGKLLKALDDSTQREAVHADRVTRCPG